MKYLKRAVFYCVVFLGLWLGVALVSPGLVYAEEMIQSVEIKGAEGFDTQLVEKSVYSRKGSVYQSERVTEDVTRLYKLGFFEDVQVKKTPVSGGVALRFELISRPPIDRIVVEGCDKVAESKVRAKITVKENLPPDNKKVAESKEQIKELYLKEGFSGAIVETEIRDRDSKKELVFKIRENLDTVIREVKFEGNTIFSSSKLRRGIKTKKKNLLSFLTSGGKLREDMIDRDIAFLTFQYLNKGYLNVRIGKPKVEFSEDKKGIVLTFYIDEGEQFKIGNITFTGDILTSAEEMLHMMSTQKGNIYSQKKLQEDLDKFSELYGNQGYAFANISPQTHLDDATRTVDLNFPIDKGQKVYVEKINISGNTITRDKVIRREMRVVENSLYNESLVKLSKRKLEQLGYFETVEIATPHGTADNRLVMNVKVKEKPTGTFSVGAGFSSVESFLFTASVSKNNFLGLGISSSVSAELSKKRQQFSFNYADPYLLDSNWMLSAEGFRINTVFEDFRRESFGGELNLGHRIFDFSSVSIGYRIEKVQLDDFETIVPEFFRRSSDGLTSSAVFNLTRDTRNNPILTTKGTYNNLSIEYAGNGLGGDNDFVRFMGNSRIYIPVWGTSSLKANARVGYIKSMNNSPIPLFERFFTGGINSLRGFELRSIGPRLTIPDSITGADREFVFGGNKILVLNLEYEFPIYDAAGFRGVLFVDAGNAFSESEDLNPFKLRSDFGAGLRWHSPFGPLRFEWGFPFKKRAGEDQMVFNFTIGSFF